MEYFYSYFGEDNYTSDRDEMHVACPFPHKDDHSGEAYYENNPSAHVNINKSVFHCKSCGRSYSEASFMAAINKIDYKQALLLIDDMRTNVNDNWDVWQENLQQSEKAMKLVKQLGLVPLVDELRIGFQGSGIAFPIFMNNILLGYCTYSPDSKPKTLLSKGAKQGIYPYDLWVDSEAPTLLCAGFKDASIGQVYGFNAITFTHGENSFPKLFKRQFKNRKVFIAYDNDEAGRKGTQKAATLIREAGGEPYIVDLSAVCTEPGEDIHDYFTKYQKTSEDLQALLDISEPFTEEQFEEERNKVYPLVKLEESTEGRYHNRIVSSRVAVIAKWEQTFQVPDVIEIEKFRVVGDNDTMVKGEKRTYVLDEDNISDLLYLCDSGLKEEQIDKYIRKLARVPQKEQGIAICKKSYVNVFKAVVVDDVTNEVIQDMEGAYKPAEITVYTLEKSLASGEKARLFYKPVPHPLQAQQVVAIATRIEESDTAIKNFQVTDEVVESLRCFQVQEGETVKSKMKNLAERVKAIAGPETLPQLAWAVDLFYHTPLQFKWGERTERGYLDAMLVGESRTGKSQTAKKLLELYEVGVFTSMQTTTKAGLIGGSDQTSGGFKTKLGVIPRNHRGAIIMEEFSKAPRDMISDLTDIRSSNVVRIDRVNGSTTAPAMVRMLSISNQRKEASGESIPIRQQSSGVDVVVKLIGAAEDVGRYDYFLFIDKPEHYISPNTVVDVEPHSKESYLNRIRWIWSRTADQIILNEDTREYVVQASEKLNRDYDCHINFFGPEAWKKLTRLAIATAANVCSIDETGEKLIVKQEHVEWAKNFLIACYDNELFNLKTYVDEERRFSQCPETSVRALQGIYNQHKTLILQIEKGTEFSQSQLKALAGLDNTDFNKVFSRLAECYFIKYSRSGEKVIPSERFRKALKKIKKSEYMAQIGSEN